jgi:beta-glucosidase
LATDPRWNRFSGTFGEDPALATDMARAYVDGFQTSTGEKEIADGWGMKV